MEQWNWNSDPVNAIYIAKSSIEGKGVFADKDIAKGEDLGSVANIRVNKKKMEHRNDYDMTPLGERLNHQNSSNAKLVQKGNTYRAVSTTNINKNNEVTLNYKNNPHFLDTNTNF